MQIPLVLLTGLVSDNRVFQYQADKLKDLANTQIINFNDVKTTSAMVDKVLKLAPSSFALGGHSLGAWVAIKVNQVAQARINKLCLINTSARGADSVEKEVRQKILIQLQNNKFPEVINDLANQFIFNAYAKHEIVEMFLQAGSQTLQNQMHAMLEREDLCEFLPKISCPTLIIHAFKDQRFTLKDHLELSKKIPNAKLAIIEDCGHMAPMECPRSVTTLMRFWLEYL